MRKWLTIQSCEWLAKIGNSKDLLVLFSIVDDVEHLTTLNNDDLQAVIVKASGSLQGEWKRKNPSFSDPAYLKNAMLHFMISKIKERVQAGKNFKPEEELELNTYSDFFPPDPDTVQISLGHVEVIEFTRNLGFLQ